MGKYIRDRTRPGDRMIRCNSFPELTGNECSVLVTLAYHDGQRCNPSDDTIVETSRLKHRSAVIDARKSLRAKGRLTWTHGEHTNEYVIAYGEPFEFGSHCPGNPDSDNHCPENPDSGNESLSGKPGHEPETTPPVEQPEQCSMGESCGYRMNPGAEFCMVCGIEASNPL